MFLASIDLVDIGDVDAVEAGGVGNDDGLRFFVGAAEFDLLPLAGADCVEVEEDGDVSFNPQEARTLFSTLTVSSRNINDNWSLYPGHAFDNRTHCVHSGCLLSH